MENDEAKRKRFEEERKAHKKNKRTNKKNKKLSGFPIQHSQPWISCH